MAAAVAVTWRLTDVRPLLAGTGANGTIPEARCRCGPDRDPQCRHRPDRPRPVSAQAPQRRLRPRARDTRAIAALRARDFPVASSIDGGVSPGAACIPLKIMRWAPARLRGDLRCGYWSL